MSDTPDIDPAALYESGDVPTSTETITVEDPDALHRFDALAGHVVVGVVDDGSVLLTTPDDGAHWMLLTVPVDPDEDWGTVATMAVEAQTGMPVAIDGVEEVRRVTYRADGGATRPTAYVVFLRATPAGDPIADLDAPNLEWFDSMPPETVEDEVGSDVGRFF